MVVVWWLWWVWWYEEEEEEKEEEKRRGWCGNVVGSGEVGLVIVVQREDLTVKRDVLRHDVIGWFRADKTTSQAAVERFKAVSEAYQVREAHSCLPPGMTSRWMHGGRLRYRRGLCLGMSSLEWA